MNAQHHMPQYERLESLSAGFNANDTQRISALTETVLSVPHYLDIPSIALTLLKPKVEKAEIAYWQGQNPGVRESEIVKAVNELSDALKLPEHAKTTKGQVHELRMSILFMNPRFMGLKIAKKPEQHGKFQISEVMSPLQAIHLVLTLEDEKFVGEKYQVTPAEWEASHSQPSAATTAGTSAGRVRTSNTPRTCEMIDGLHNELSALSDSDGLDLLLRILTHFGIA